MEDNQASRADKDFLACLKGRTQDRDKLSGNNPAGTQLFRPTCEPKTPVPPLVAWSP
jgi:hypothetical protein